MKKLIFMVTLITLFMTASVISFAEESEEMKGSMMDKCPMHGMMKMMMSKEMVATGDGGVIVMTGTKLMKFDKDLNLVKEAEVKMDTEGMHKMMKEMKEKCPMYKKMMGEGGMMKKDSMRCAEGSKAAEEMTGHGSHH